MPCCVVRRRVSVACGTPMHHFCANGSAKMSECPAPVLASRTVLVSFSEMLRLEMSQGSNVSSVRDVETSDNNQ